jgi:glycosyltransferase involved in cell wall biosynthesis
VGEVVDDRVGFLIPPGDGQALEGALIALAGNYELQEVLGTNARDRASQFDFRAVGRLMLEQFS